VRNDDEREIRLRPRKPPIPKTGDRNATWSMLFKGVMLHARMTRKARSRASRETSALNRGAGPYHQRCAVRVTFSRSKVRGQWRAHGRYCCTRDCNTRSRFKKQWGLITSVSRSTSRQGLIAAKGRGRTDVEVRRLSGIRRSRWPHGSNPRVKLMT
jgi:hypothetical protein